MLTVHSSCIRPEILYKKVVHKSFFVLNASLSSQENNFALVPVSVKLQEKESYIGIVYRTYIRIIHLERTENFPKKQYFLPPDTEVRTFSKSN